MTVWKEPVPGHKGLCCLQAQTSAPEWHHRQVVRLPLTAAAAASIATQELCVEVWHSCPRTLAVASALSHGLSSAASGGASHHVYLGAAGAQLAPLLYRSAGVKAWLPLTARNGKLAGARTICLCLPTRRCLPTSRSDAGTLCSGAINVSVQLLALDSHLYHRSICAVPPLEDTPALARLLPPSSLWLARPPDQGFHGQWARLTVEMRALHFPTFADVQSAGHDLVLELALPCSSSLLRSPVACTQDGPLYHGKCAPCASFLVMRLRCTC